MRNQTVTNESILRFGEFLRKEEKAEATCEKYIRDIRRFLRFLSGKFLKKELAIEYKDALLSGGYSPRSVNSIIASLNAYFDFAGACECKLKTLKLQRQIYCPEEKELTRAEYVRLVQAAARAGNERLNLIIQTICGTGIRVSELKFITAEAVRAGEAIVRCKGKTRAVFIVRALQKKLLSFMKREGISEGCVFVTRTKKPVCRTNVWKEMKALCKQAAVSPSKVFPHNLRHLFARTFYGIEKDIAKLADVLGHSSVDTTRIYIMTSGQEHRRRMEGMRLII